MSPPPADAGHATHESNRDVPRGASLLARIGAIGAAAQASVPGLYAWGVTVAPAAWARGAPLIAKVSAVAGLLALVAGVSLERRLGARARYVAVWGLVVTSAVTWIAAPAGLGPLRLDTPRGVAGTIGWALFAFASAAPALRADAPTAARVVDDEPLRPRTHVRRGDVVYIVTAIVVALSLQAIGWRVLVPERALLVRFATLACGLSLVGAATSVSLARHGRSAARPARVRFRSALVWLALLVVMSGAGLLLFAR